METKIIDLDQAQKEAIKKLITQNNNVNLVLNMINTNVSDKDLEEIFNFSRKSNNGTTFVVVKKDVDFDAFSEEWNIVPTIEEAKDLISLDEMMRDLE